HYTKDCNAKIKQDGTRTPYDYFNSPHTCYSTLTTSFLPPVDLQKGKRDAQVQFRGRRHTAPLFQRSSSRTFLKGCNPAGSRVAAVFASTFLSSSLTRVEAMESYPCKTKASVWQRGRRRDSEN
ncbi:hypothetical protein T03_14237, partial [Trichinella britovi]